MDGNGFDGKTRVLGAAVTRRAATTGMLGSGLAALVALAGESPRAEAAKRHKRRRRRRRRQVRCLPNGAPISDADQDRCCDGFFGSACSKPCAVDEDCNPGQSCFLLDPGDGFCANKG
jgi:hypothetical protein